MLDTWERLVPLLRRSLLAAAIVWTLIVAGMLAWDVRRIVDGARDQALSDARANFKKDMAVRYWAASHGGVYVPVDDRTPPSPYLKDIPERDVYTPSGKRLTLMNPAYITRQINKYFLDMYGVAGHLTSLKPLNPDDKPDEWERAALGAFERGEKEISSLANIGGKKHLRMMRPMVTEASCLKCHEQQGYKVGDVRGGLSVSIPMEQYENFARRELLDHLAANSVLWLVGLLGLTIGHRWILEQLMARVEVQKALTGSEETRRLLLDNMAEAVFGTDSQGVATFVNPACLSMLGYQNSDELVGKKIHFLIHHTHEDGTPSPESQCAISFVTKMAKPTHKEKEILWRKDGSSFTAEIWFHPVIKEGVVMGSVVNFIDITGRLKAEAEKARLFTAMEQSEEIVVITDPEGTIQYVNRAFETVTGYDRAEAIGANPRILKSGKQSPEFYVNLWNAIKSGSPWKGRFVNKRKDGSLYEEDATISPVTGATGAITGFVAVKRDVTRQSMLQKARDYFTTVTSHELRTPLTKLSLAKLVLEKMELHGKLDAEELRVSISALEASIADFQRIVTAGEMFTDLALLKKTIFLKQAPLTPILRYCVELSLKKLVEEKRSLELIVDVAAAEGEDVAACDQAMIQYAVIEVISNAAKYTPDGKRITARLENEGGWIVITVKDEGIGMPRDKKDSAFEPFFSPEKLETFSSGKYAFRGGGIGMGLTMARRIFQTHGGGLELDTEGEGRGVSVRMTIPASAPAGAGEKPSAPREPQSPPAL